MKTFRIVLATTVPPAVTPSDGFYARLDVE